MFEIGNVVGDYSLLEEIGCGASGTIFKAVKIKTQEVKALKAIPIINKLYINEVSQELKIGMEIGNKCSYLVHYDSVFMWHNFLCIIMEYFENGDLKKYLNNKNNLKEGDIVKLTCQVGDALDTLHEKDVIHRDLKLENIFVTSNGNFKLGDYGISRKEGVSMTLLPGTEGYQAPEILDGEKYGKAADIYSFGIIIYKLMSGGKHPFVNTQGKFSMLKAASGKYDLLMGKEISEELKELCYQMMHLQPEKRPTIKQVLSNPWIKKRMKEKKKEEEENLEKENNELRKENSELKKKMDELRKENDKLKNFSFLSDPLIPLTDLLFVNPYEKFTLEGRVATFNCKIARVRRSLVFKEGRSNGVMEVKIKYGGDENGAGLGVTSFSRIQNCFIDAIGWFSCGGASFNFWSWGSNFWCGGKCSGYFQKEGSNYNILPDSDSAVITGILDMRESRHTMHFLVGKELLPHAIVKIPNEKMYIGFASNWNSSITLICLSFYCSPPLLPFKKCIGYNYDGSNVSENKFTNLKFEDGSSIPNIDEYIIKKL